MLECLRCNDMYRNEHNFLSRTASSHRIEPPVGFQIYIKTQQNTKELQYRVIPTDISLLHTVFAKRSGRPRLS